MKAFNFAKQTNQLVRALPYLLFIFLLSFTLFVWQRVDYFNQTKAESVFINKTIEIKSRIKMRLEEHEKLLRGGIGLFNSVGNVTRTQWRQYVAALELDQNHPGIQGMGFSIWLKPNEKSANIVKIRAEGFPDYTINPEGERSFYTSIIYLEPFNWRNQRAFGYDMYSEPIRKKAIDQAIDTGIATITNKIILLQETEVEKQSGILMYVPVYRVGSVIDSAEARRRAIKGLVHSPIRMHDFIFASIGNNYQDVAIEIYDEGGPSANKLLYSSKNTGSKNATSTYLPRFEKIEKFIIFHDREWHLHFKSLPIFDSAVKNNDAYFVLVFGIILSYLLSFITYSSLEARQRSLKLVEEKTKELKASESSYRAIHDNSPLGIVQLDSNYRFVSANPAFVQILGYTEPELKQKTIFAVTHPDDIDKSKEAAKIFTKQLGTISRFAKRYLHKNGKIIWTLVSSRTVRSEETGEELIFSTIEDITDIRAKEVELEKTQKLLAESELRYRKFFENNKSVMLIIDPNDGKIIDANLAAQKYYGWTIAELKQLNIHEINIASADEINTALKKSTMEETNRFCFKHRKANGGIFDVEVFSTPIQLDAKILIYTIIHDITERVQFEKNLKTSEQKFQAVLRASEIAIAWANEKSEIEYINPKFISLFGYSVDDIHTLEQWYLCAYPDPIYRNKVIAEWNTKVSNSLPAKTAIEPMEVSVTCKNGSVRHVLLAGSWFENNILANFSDITERKRMETELQLAASVFSNSFDGIIISNAKNLILDVSPSFSRITGYNRNEVIGKTPKIFSSGRHDSEFYTQMWYSLNKYDFWSGEIWNRRKNGEIFPLTLSISAVKNKENQVQHYVAFFSDISVIKKNEATLIEARQQAEAATVAKSRFLATMSHEIRTPMNGILGMAQLLAMTNVSDAERQEYAQIIINSGNVLLTLLNDILDFSKVEAGKIELEHVVIDPKQIIQDTQMLFADTARRKSLNYECVSGLVQIVNSI